MWLPITKELTRNSQICVQSNPIGQLSTNPETKVKADLTKRTVLGKIASDRFPIHFTSREVNKPLVVLRTVFHLQNIPKLNKIKSSSIITPKPFESVHGIEVSTYHRKRVDEVAVNRVERTSVVVRRSADRGEIDRLSKERKSKAKSREERKRNIEEMEEEDENASGITRSDILMRPSRRESCLMLIRWNWIRSDQVLDSGSRRCLILSL